MSAVGCFSTDDGNWLTDSIVNVNGASRGELRIKNTIEICFVDLYNARKIAFRFFIQQNCIICYYVLF